MTEAEASVAGREPVVGGNVGMGTHLDVDRALVGLDHGDDITSVDDVVRPHVPLDDGAGVHVGAERRHGEVDGRHLPTAVRAATTTSSTRGSAASSRWRA